MFQMLLMPPSSFPCFSSFYSHSKYCISCLLSICVQLPLIHLAGQLSSILLLDSLLSVCPQSSPLHPVPLVKLCLYLTQHLCTLLSSLLFKNYLRNLMHCHYCCSLLTMQKSFKQILAYVIYTQGINMTFMCQILTLLIIRKALIMHYILYHIFFNSLEVCPFVYSFILKNMVGVCFAFISFSMF